MGGPTRSGSFYVDLECSLDSGTKILTIPSIELPTTNDSSVRNVRATALLFDSAGAFVGPPLFSNWIIPEQLAPNTDFAALNAYNADPSNRPPSAITPTLDQLLPIIAAMLSNDFLATDSSAGISFLSFPPVIGEDPVVVALNDPLFRDALLLRGTNIQDFTVTPPSDAQPLVFNGTAQEWQAAAPGFGQGNVTSNEVATVDGQLMVAQGTGGKTIRKVTETGIVALDAGVVGLQLLVVREVPSGVRDGVNAAFTLAHTPIAGTESVYVAGRLQNSNVALTLDYVIADDTITFQAGHLPQTGDAVLVSYRYAV